MSFLRFLRQRSGLLQDMMESTSDSDDDASMLDALALTDAQQNGVLFVEALCARGLLATKVLCAELAQRLLGTGAPEPLLEALQAYAEMDSALQVIDMLLFDADLVSVLRFEQKRRSGGMTESQFLMEKTLGEFVKNVPELCSMLQLTGAVVAGGAALKGFHDGLWSHTWTDGDLDIWQHVKLPPRHRTPLHPTWSLLDSVHMEHAAEVRHAWQQFLTNHGATVELDTDEEYIESLVLQGSTASILHVIRFKSITGRPIQLIFVCHPVDEVVSLFDMEVVKCSFDGSLLISHHPQAIVQRQTKITPRQQNAHRLFLRTEKYRCRGYTVTM